MNRRKRVARNILLLVVLSYLFLNVSGLHVSPTWAHEHSERSMHYGPSKVVHIENFNAGKLFLGKYDKWISCNPVLRMWLFFWRFGSSPAGYEYDSNKPLDYSWASDSGHYRLYGIVNDKSIERVEITLDDGTMISTMELYEHLFLLTWKSTEEQELYAKSIRGYDAEGNLVFEEDQPH